MTSIGCDRRRIGCGADGQPLLGRIDSSRRFHIRFQATDADIDELGHVNNATWVVWIQDAAVAHWLAVARPQDRDCFVAVVLRHEIDYRGNIRLGELAQAVTWIEGIPRGVRYTRRVEFRSADEKILVWAVTQWALLDRESGGLVRISAELAAPFLTPPCR